MLNSKFFVDKMGSQIVEKFPDPVQLNALFEIAQKMIDEGKEKKEIKKILKDLYGASKEELARMEEKLFKNQVNAEVHPDAVLTELKAIASISEDNDYEYADLNDLSPSPSIVTRKLMALITELEGDKGTKNPKEKHAGGDYMSDLIRSLTQKNSHIVREVGYDELTISTGSEFPVRVKVLGYDKPEELEKLFEE